MSDKYDYDYNLLDAQEVEIDLRRSIRDEYIDESDESMDESYKAYIVNDIYHRLYGSDRRIHAGDFTFDGFSGMVTPWALIVPVFCSTCELCDLPF
tara:strand:+ start:16080 stop:16367 length:288 start_codon:yes stop_codon:yes gene_type:complete